MYLTTQPDKVTETFLLPLRTVVASSSATLSSRSEQQSPPRSAAFAGVCVYAPINKAAPAATSRREHGPSPHTMNTPCLMLLLYRTGRLTQCDRFSFCQESLEPFSFVSSLHTKCWLCASQPLARGARNRVEVGYSRMTGACAHHRRGAAHRQQSTSPSCQGYSARVRGMRLAD